VKYTTCGTFRIIEKYLRAGGEPKADFEDVVDRDQL
jgi:hypothetical protein